MVTVKPGFDDNQQLVTGCSGSGPCTSQGTNFVYLHTEPDAASPLVKDAGLHPDGSYSTTQVSDHGARLAAGQKVVVAQKSGDWLGVSYLGDIGWLYSPKTHPTVLPSGGRTVSAKPGAQSVPVYAAALVRAQSTLLHLVLDTEVITSRTTIAAIRANALKQQSAS